MSSGSNAYGSGCTGSVAKRSEESVHLHRKTDRLRTTAQMKHRELLRSPRFLTTTFVVVPRPRLALLPGHLTEIPALQPVTHDRQLLTVLTKKATSHDPKSRIPSPCHTQAGHFYLTQTRLTHRALKSTIPSSTVPNRSGPPTRPGSRIAARMRAHSGPSCLASCRGVRHWFHGHHFGCQPGGFNGEQRQRWQEHKEGR